jgi:hypothetical protein
MILKSSEKRYEKIRAFAEILQAIESPRKVLCRLCTAGVRGSNPLGSTVGMRRFAGKVYAKTGRTNCWWGLCAATQEVNEDPVNRINKFNAVSRRDDRTTGSAGKSPYGTRPRLCRLYFAVSTRRIGCH